MGGGVHLLGVMFPQADFIAEGGIQHKVGAGFEGLDVFILRFADMRPETKGEIGVMAAEQKVPGQAAGQPDIPCGDRPRSDGGAVLLPQTCVEEDMG